MIKTLSTLSTLALATTTLLGQVVIYDGFSGSTYTAGETINTLGGGSNWSSNWGVNTSNANNPLRYQGATAGLSYTDGAGNTLAGTSGSMELFPGGSGAGEASRSFSSALTGDVWMSFLNIRTTNGSWNWEFRLSDAGGTAQLSIQNASTSGRFRLNQSGASSSNLALDNFNTTWTPAEDAQLYLLHISNVGSGSANSNITLWVNPNNILDLGAGAASSVSMTDRQVNAVTQFVFNKGAGLDQTGFFDELRIGASATDVLVAVPEPSTYAALLGLGALALVAYRRRR